MKVVLHIGTPKTGTTALQRCFTASSGRLRRHGILYPSDPLHRAKQQLLAAEISGPVRNQFVMRKLGRRGDAMRAEWVAALGDRVARERPGIVVISNESFFRAAGRDKLDHLREDLLGIGARQIEVVAYLRRPSDQYLSALQQKIKASQVVRPPFQRPVRDVLTGYREVFGADHVHLRKFDRDALAGGDIVTDFVQGFLSDSGLDPSGLRRPGMSTKPCRPRRSGSCATTAHGSAPIRMTFSCRSPQRCSGPCKGSTRRMARRGPRCSTMSPTM